MLWLVYVYLGDDMTLSDNDTAALDVVYSMAFNRYIYSTILIRSRNEENYQGHTTMFGNIDDQTQMLHLQWQLLGQWHKGEDITDHHYDDGYSIRRDLEKNNERSDRGMITILHNILDVCDSNTVDANDHHKRMVKMLLLMDLWYAGDDITQYALSLGL